MELPRFPPWKRDPETEEMLREISRLRSEDYERHPPPSSPPGDWAETIFFTIPLGILLGPIIVAATFKEEVIDPRRASKEEIAETLKYWRELKARGWRRERY